jgi:hypothetical protein
VLIDETPHDEILLGEDAIEADLPRGWLEIDLDLIACGAQPALYKDSQDSILLQIILQVSDPVVFATQE